MVTVLTGLGVAGWWGWSVLHAPMAPVEFGAGKSAGGAVLSSPFKATSPASNAASPNAAAPNVAATRDKGVEAVSVEAVKARLADVVDDTVAVGNLRARQSVVLRPEIAGRIAHIGFRDGERVAAGTLLIQLDDTLMAAEVSQARAELALSEANHRRTTDLAQRNFVSGSALDQALASLRIQQAKLRLAEARQSRTRIHAPFAGVLGLRNISPGDFVKEGDELVVLEDLSAIKVDLRLPERFAGQLRRGQAIRLTVDAYPDREFPAVLDAFDVQIDASGRSLLARGQLANPDGGLRSGMFAKARIELDRRPGAVMVPEEAVLPQGGVNYVFTVADGKAARRPVTLGQRRAGEVEIVGSVRAGEWVVTAGQPKLEREGVPVKMIEARGPALPIAGR